MQVHTRIILTSVHLHVCMCVKFLLFHYDDIGLVVTPFVSETTDFYDIVPVGVV